MNRSEEMVKHLRKSRDEEEARYESEKSVMKEQHEVMARAKDEEINTLKTELLKAQKAAENAKEAAGMEAQARMDQMRDEMRVGMDRAIKAAKAEVRESAAHS